MKKTLLAAFCSYTFFLLVNNALSSIVYKLYLGRRFSFMWSGFVCQLVPGKQFPYVSLIYFAVKLAIALLAAWLVVKKKKDAAFNLLLLNMAVFNFGGAMVVLGNKALHSHTIPDVFFSDEIIYVLSGVLIPNAYFLLPLILGIIGVIAVLMYFRKYRFSNADRLRYIGALAAGVAIPVLVLNLLMHLFR